MNTKKKNNHIETIRGLAIALVVIGHVIGSDANGAMKVPDDSFFRYIYISFIKYTQIPLFTVIAGWVYALKPFHSGSLSLFYLKKAQRLLLPMITVGGIYYIIQSLTPGTNISYELKDIWRICIFPYTLYWYLQSLFFCFIVIAILDKFSLLATLRNYFIVLTFSFLLLYIRDHFIPDTFPNYFGFKGGIHLITFFLIGLGFKRFDFNNQFFNKKLLWCSIIIFVACFSIQQLVWFDVLDYHISLSSGVGLLIGISIIVISMLIKFENKLFVWLGRYAYTIYLFHSFGTSGSRIFLNKTGIHSTPVIFFVSLLLGIFLPVIIETVLDKIKFTRFLFLGKNYKKQQ